MNKTLEMTDFSKKVIRFIKKVPPGKIATYGQIAILAGKPQGARGVGWILHACTKSHGLPWQRIINSQGRISFPRESSRFTMQKKLLAKEKIKVSDVGIVELRRYQWHKK